MNRLNWQIAYFRQQLGWAGLIAMLGFVWALIYLFTVVHASENSLDEARQAINAAKTEIQTNTFKVRPVNASPDMRLQSFKAHFPDINSINETWKRLAKLSEDAGLTIDRTHYVPSSEQHAGLLSYRLNIPVKASYPQIRDFLATVIHSLPNVALEQLAFKRESVDSPIVDANIALIIYLRAP